MHDIYVNLVKTVTSWKHRKEPLNNTQHEILQLVVGTSYSAYEIKSYFKNKKKHLDYKNVHRRVKKLEELGLIKTTKTTTKQSIHGAIFYTLSEVGVYYLVRQTITPMAKHVTLVHLLKEIVISSKDNILFRTVLEPYLEINTIQNMYGTVQLHAIWQYLRGCCEEIEKAIETINNTQSGGQQIFIWNDVRPGEARPFRELKDTRLAEYLNRELKLDWLDNAEIIKFGDDKTLKISHGSNSVLINLNEDKRTAVLKMNRKQVKKPNVTLLPSEDGSLFVRDINVSDISIEEWAILLLSAKLKQLFSQLVFSLIGKGLTENDIKVLSQDDKFIHLLKQTRNSFERDVQIFLPTRKSSKK